MTGNPALGSHVLIVFSLAAAGLAMHAYVRSVSGSRAGAWLAGIAWAFLSIRFAHLSHLPLLSLCFLPLAFLFLHRVVAGRRRRDLVLLGLAAGLQAISSADLAPVGAVALIVAAAGLAVAVGRWRSVPLVRRLLLAASIAALLAAPFAWKSWQVQRQEGFPAIGSGSQPRVAVPQSYLRVPSGNLLYRRTGWLRPRDTAGAQREEPELELFPGGVLAVLALLGAWRSFRSDTRPLAFAMIAVGLTGFVLSLGPGPWPWLGIGTLVVPARFGVLVSFALGPLAAVGLRGVVEARKGQRGATLLAAVLVTASSLEALTAPQPTVPAPVFQDSEIESRLPIGELPPPPDAGPLPFGEEERAVYRVMWLSGGQVGLPAGQAVFEARRLRQERAGGAAVHLSLEVATAGWVETFFAARDRFETWTDGAILPLRQHQQLREGRRQVEREFTFDAFNHMMTTGEGGPAVPVPTSARDGLSALLFARSLPLADGYAVSVPVVEGGERWTARLRVAAAQAEVAGRRVEAWRVRARVVSESNRQPIGAALLLTRDARRLPLEIAIDAGVGSFRAELADHTSR